MSEDVGLGKHGSFVDVKDAADGGRYALKFDGHVYVRRLPYHGTWGEWHRVPYWVLKEGYKMLKAVNGGLYE